MTLMPVSKISRLGREIGEERRLAVDWPILLGFHGAPPVNRFAQQVEDAAERLLADGHEDRLACIDDRHAADEAIGRAERHAAHPVAAHVLLDLAGESNLRAVGLVVNSARVVNLGKMAFLEFGVEGRADHLNDASLMRGRGCFPVGCSRHMSSVEQEIKKVAGVAANIAAAKSFIPVLRRRRSPPRSPW